MPPIRRRLRAAALILSGLAAAGAPALAQNEASNSIGPPQLKDFSLPGQRTTPPAAPVPAPRTPVAEPAAPPAAAPATSEPPAAARRTEAPPRPAGTVPAAPAPGPATPDPATAEPATVEPSPGTEPALPVQALPEPPAEPVTEPAPARAPAAAEPKGSGWLWPAAGGALLLAFAAFFLFRRRRALAEREAERDSARGELGGVLMAEPQAGPRAEPEVRPVSEPRPEPEPSLPPEVPAAPRPWIELDIVPERAAATENEVYVRYALTLTNKGDSDARNIRIDPRLFNAGAEGEMLAFFQGAIHELSGSPHVVIRPGGSLKLNGQVAMPNAELREIELGGRRIFVPMVAINVAYDWAGGGAGRTSRSWLVGREAEVPTEKMGPFRLDLGPRIYRSVGRREARLVMV
jgi:LPXTG-motif cell wall-anchored protein